MPISINCMKCEERREKICIITEISLLAPVCLWGVGELLIATQGQPILMEFPSTACFITIMKKKVEIKMEFVCTGWKGLLIFWRSTISWILPLVCNAPKIMLPF